MLWNYFNYEVQELNLLQNAFKVQQGLLQIAIIINTNCDTVIARCFLFLGKLDLSSLICSFWVLCLEYEKKKKTDKKVREKFT